MIKEICAWIVKRSGINSEIDGKIRNIEQPKIERIRIAEVPAGINMEAISYRDTVMEGLLEGLRGLDERLKTREQMEVIAAPDDPQWKHPKSINSVRVDVQERQRQEDMMRRDEVLSALDTRIKGLNSKMDRADAVVSKVISEGAGSSNMAMIGAMYSRLEAMEQGMRQLGSPQAEKAPKLIGAGALVKCPKCGYEDATTYTLDPKKPLTCPKCMSEWYLVETGGRLMAALPVPKTANEEPKAHEPTPEAKGEVRRVSISDAMEREEWTPQQLLEKLRTDLALECDNPIYVKEELPSIGANMRASILPGPEFARLITGHDYIEFREISRVDVSYIAGPTNETGGSEPSTRDANA